LSASQQVARRKKLLPEEEHIILRKGTETPFTGRYYSFWQKGTYVCRRCGTKLYRSEHKFEAHCGWPSFDDEVPGAIKRVADVDGRRTEIQCSNCDAHLGHIFVGENFTDKDTRHCVNSLAMEFVPDTR
jgi:methionine-R-sulfoxide reductase